MDFGQFSVSLTVKDIKVSRAFYEKLGFQMIDGNEEQNWLIMRHGEIVIGLFQGMFDKNLMTFNPPDVRAIQKKLKDAGVELIQEVEGDEGPGHITMVDPDGNPIMFDQHNVDHEPSVKQASGKVAWLDLTVPDAENVRDFYAAVVGWTPAPVPVEDHTDYNMLWAGQPTTGICHKKGGNKDMPSQWMPYFTVTDYDGSLAKVEANGGKILVPTRGTTGHRFAVIEDPAGAVCALYEGKY